MTVNDSGQLSKNTWVKRGVALLLSTLDQTNNDAYLPDIHKPSCSDESSLTRSAINANELISPHYTNHCVLSCDTNGVGDKYQVDNITVK